MSLRGYRWASLIGCGVVAACSYKLLELALGDIFSAIAGRLAGLPPSHVFFGFIVLSSAACWAFGGSRWSGFFGFRRFFAYPPTWVAMLAAVLTLAVMAPSRAASAPADIAWFFSSIFWPWYFALLIPPIVVGLSGTPAAPAPPARRPKHNLSNFEGLLAWIRDDTPISHPDQDLFGHDGIAERIADRLKEDKPASIAIVGPVGSGKSTIRRLTQHHLADAPHVRIVEISLWPYDSGEAAVRGILGKLVEELGTHVNILPLIGISDNYLAAIERSTGLFGAFARILRATESPEAIVSRISRIAQMANLKLVLWVEDFERFAANSAGANADTTREAERLGPIRALLHLLDRLSAVSVVIADASLRPSFDIHKIVQYIEPISTFREEHSWNIIDIIRTHCLSGHPRPFIDPATTAHREVLGQKTNFRGSDLWSEDFGHPSPKIAILWAVPTPRQLKTTLRLTMEAWRTLCGEIDFDSLLVGCAIRVSKPHVFDLINTHIDIFRIGSRKNSDAIQPHYAVFHIDQLMTDAEPREKMAVRALVSYLFPKYLLDNGQNRTAIDDYDNPQGFHLRGYFDKWSQFLRLENAAPDDADQLALSRIDLWKRGNTSPLIDHLIDPVRGNQIVCFAKQFTQQQVEQLLRDVAARLTFTPDARRDLIDPFPGMEVMYRILEIHGLSSNIEEIQPMANEAAHTDGLRESGEDR